LDRAAPDTKRGKMIMRSTWQLGSGFAVLAWLALGACSSEPSTPAGAGGSAGMGATPGTAGTTPGAAGTSASGGTAGQGAAGSSVGGVSQAGAGTAGTSAGSGGAAGGAGGGGAPGGSSGAGGGGGGLPGAVRSAGCGMAPGQALTSYVKYSETITGVTDKQAPRNYYVYLPEGYEPGRAYPLVFIGPGCGSDGQHGIQIQSATGKDAIIVGLDPSTAVDPQGRQCFDSQTFPDPEVPYFDQTLAAVEAKFCVDKSRIFIEGFSSGSWLSHLLGCVDAGTIRAQGNASGCMQGVPPNTCTKPIAYMGIHNDPDPNNSYGCGTQARDEKIKRNGCTNETMPYTPVGLKTPPNATIDCVQYVGCKKGYPVVFCTTKNVDPNHSPQDDSSTALSTAAMWDFWMNLEAPE
jgi:poly(3-hydroxybutyrate) depolymerase